VSEIDPGTLESFYDNSLVEEAVAKGGATSTPSSGEQSG
jgi:hypothetical protein